MDPMNPISTKVVRSDYCQYVFGNPKNPDEPIKLRYLQWFDEWLDEVKAQAVDVYIEQKNQQTLAETYLIDKGIELGRLYSVRNIIDLIKDGPHETPRKDRERLIGLIKADK
jgi:hypothetical protein